MTRESVEGRGVDGPRTGPAVRRCRPAERESVRSLVGSRERVLDVGSPPHVTAAIGADSIERVDFSDAESDLARDALVDAGVASAVETRTTSGSVVDEFTVVDPGEPTLPFPDDSFDAAVAVGPYDWPSLASELLTREVGRVLEPEGRFVLSTLSEGSPDVVPDGPLRGRDASATSKLLAPGWALERSEGVFRPDADGATLLDSLPPRARAAVDRCRAALPGLSRGPERDARERIATVVAGSPLPYERWLEAALQRLFRPVDDGGFWDASAGRFVAALATDADATTLDPIRDLEVERVRTPFVAAAVLRWRTSPAGTDAFDDRLRQLLSHLGTIVEEERIEEQLSPAAIGAVIDAFARAGSGPFDATNVATARDCFERTRGHTFDRPSDAGLLAGWATLATIDGGRDDAVDHRVLAALDEGVWRAGERLFPKTLEDCVDPSAAFHEGHHRGLGGLCRGIQVTGRFDHLESVADVLETAIENRLRDEGRFVLDAVPRSRESAAPLPRLDDGTGYEPAEGELARPRHQSVFVETVARYVAAGGPRVYDREVARAMSWLDGGGPLEGSCFEAGALDVPPRVVGTESSDPPRVVAGLDDVGALVAATTDLVAGPLAPASPVGPERLPAPPVPR